jgi:hypothetical protein
LTEEQIYLQQKYSKRKIVNNEYRFNEEENVEEKDETPTIQQLLELGGIMNHNFIAFIQLSVLASSNSTSHFRFQDEKDWDDEVAMSNKVFYTF